MIAVVAGPGCARARAFEAAAARAGLATRRVEYGELLAGGWARLEGADGVRLETPAGIPGSGPR